MTAIPEIDLGTDGPAARARPGAMVRVEGEWRGTIRDGVAEAYRYGDATLYDRMHARGQLSDAQHAAAERLGEVFEAAGLVPHATGQYGAVVGGGDGSDGPDARHDYRQTLRELPDRQAWAVDGLMHDQHPGYHGVPDLHAGLDAIARKYGLDNNR